MRKLAIHIIAFSVVLFAVKTHADDLQLPRADFVVTWSTSLPANSKGYGLILRPRAIAATQPTAAVTDWRNPQSPAAFGVGFNTFNPPTTNPFDANGNIEDNPQREASLHLGGREIANRLSPVGLGKIESPATNPAATQATTQPAESASVPMRLAIHFICGGSEVTLSASDQAIYDRYFVPELFPKEYVPSFGGDATIKDVQIQWKGQPLPEPAAPIHIVAFDHAITDKTHSKADSTVEFPPAIDHVGRVIATVTLDKTPAGIDGWDRIGLIYITDDNGKQIELIRYITPYRKAWQWKTDVTDMLPLLKGRRDMQVQCGTGGEGWLVSLHLDFYPGALEHVPFKVTNIWDTTVLLGQKDKPTDKQLPPTALVIDPGTKLIKLRTLVTGHGMDPNAKNAGEFCPLSRTVHVGQMSYSNLLWKTDNYLNPCRPQGGTWKYSRAGWGPGTLVEPWTIDITGAVRSGNSPTLSYEIEPYENPKPAAGFPAQQRISVQVIEFR